MDLWAQWARILLANRQAVPVMDYNWFLVVLGCHYSFNPVLHPGVVAFVVRISPRPLISRSLLGANHG